MQEIEEEAVKTPNLRQDLTVLMKVRLNFFVLVTTFFGYLLARKGVAMEWDILFHTIIGTAAAAFGSAAFNQLMEIDLDLLMKRTADRPLPSRRMSPVTAFGVGWVLSAMGIIHLAVMVNPWAAYLTAATVAIYVFVYTPMKRMSSVNTLVGAIPGAIPPMIGWVGGGGGVVDPEAWFLFGILFFWQLPHFVAINWLCRIEYEEAGYKMWSNGDVSGKKSGLLCVIFALMLAAFSLLPGVWGFANLVWLVGGTLLALMITALGVRFLGDGERKSCRQLFFSTLIYLPVALTLLLIAWKG
ncbi:MAG: heme o synthase [Akkermansiaceae bacterium]|nr:heme o synthase [Akkermansiaceae bacterium]MDP4646600.1 heme o synthase [Akkermansiaceae bacterium]MDP4720201.1 heme o synthase [Akkermansiaceae bacterium]MDP4779809.1 heme o synthase [Akkermansiaceae bacterium]MDP4896704.1 heme o synthase [Akkermansiaceae bacterium]